MMQTAMRAEKKQRGKPAALEPPPLTPLERERIQRALEGYDKNSLIRIALRFGYGLSRELAERSREELEAAILRSCGEPAAVRRMLEGLSPLQLQLLEIAAGERGVVEEAELLRAAMQAVPPRTLDRFDWVRPDFHERRERALPAVIELYSRGLLWPLVREGDEEKAASEGKRAGRRTERSGPPKRSLVGAYELPGEPFAWLHPFVRFWLTQQEGWDSKPARNWRTASTWWSQGGVVLAESGAGALGRSLAALLEAARQEPVRLDGAGKLPKAVVEALVQAAQRPEGGEEPKRAQASPEKARPVVWACGAGGFAAFVLAVGIGMGLLVRSGSAVEVREGAEERLRELCERDRQRELLRQATAAWLASGTFNELALIPELAVAGCTPYDEPPPYLPPPLQHRDAQVLQKGDMDDELRRAVARARRSVVEHLKGFAVGGWTSFDELAEWLRQQAPDFLFEPEKLGVGILRDTYRGIYERTPDGRALTVPPGVRWRLVEERLLARLLLGPLLALGLVAVRWDRESEAPQQLQVSETLRAFVP